MDDYLLLCIDQQLAAQFAIKMCSGSPEHGLQATIPRTVSVSMSVSVSVFLVLSFSVSFSVSVIVIVLQSTISHFLPRFLLPFHRLSDTLSPAVCHFNTASHFLLLFSDSLSSSSVARAVVASYEIVGSIMSGYRLTVSCYRARGQTCANHVLEWLSCTQANPVKTMCNFELEKPATAGGGQVAQFGGHELQWCGLILDKESLEVE